MAQGQKGRKIGRNTKRPSNMRYKQTQRWVTNAAKRAKRTVRKAAKQAIKKIMWSIRKGKSNMQAEAAKLQELRHTVSQNHT